MYASLLPYMRCVRCRAAGLRENGPTVACPSCGASFPVAGGILDTLQQESRLTITPFQRLMQSRVVVSLYENSWRRTGYFIASSRPFRDELGTVLGFYRPHRAERALDLACGTGVFTRPLARESAGTVVGLDLSWPMLRQARRLVEREALGNVPLIRGSAFTLPFADCGFGYVNCCGALHLFENPGAALDEVARVLAPGGHLCVQTTLRPDRSGGTAYFLEKYIRFGFFREPELHELISQRGFKILETERHRISYTFLARRLG
jgi:ubiquinone/menaquinone biosynthesis C-methylase UbiE